MTKVVKSNLITVLILFVSSFCQVIPEDLTSQIETG